MYRRHALGLAMALCLVGCTSRDAPDDAPPIRARPLAAWDGCQIVPVAAVGAGFRVDPTTLTTSASAATSPHHRRCTYRWAVRGLHRALDLRVRDGAPADHTQVVERVVREGLRRPGDHAGVQTFTHIPGADGGMLYSDNIAHIRGLLARPRPTLLVTLRLSIRVGSTLGDQRAALQTLAQHAAAAIE